MKEGKRIFLFSLAAGILVCALGGLLETQVHFLQRLYDDRVLDNENHYLSCNELPSTAEVEAVMNANQDIINEIIHVNPGNTGVEMDANTCPGHADLVIWYASHADRLAIKAILGAETFHGIPYRMQNR